MDWSWESVILGVGIFYAGVFIGFFLLKKLVFNRMYSGTIHVIVNPDKTLFSLELDDNPEDLMFRSEVLFKVETSEPSEADRE